MQQRRQCELYRLIRLFSCDVIRFTADQPELNVVKTFKATKPPIAKDSYLFPALWHIPLDFLGNFNQKLQYLRGAVFLYHKNSVAPTAPCFDVPRSLRAGGKFPRACLNASPLINLVDVVQHGTQGSTISCQYTLVLVW